MFGYKGQSGVYTDTETGLVLMTHRYFDPVTARWLTRDPVGTKGGTNLYAYCNNRPTRMQDREGTSPLIYACLPCAACLIDIALVCSDSMDSASQWAQCAIGVVQNLPWWLKLGCGGACLACLYDLIKDPPIVCEASMASMPTYTAQLKKPDDPCDWSCQLVGRFVCERGLTVCVYVCLTKTRGEVTVPVTLQPGDTSCPDHPYK